LLATADVVIFPAAMNWVHYFRVLLAVLCGLVLCGCHPGGRATVDEEKEPQFLIGRSRVNAMNFRGAIEAFEQALEMNPRSAAAHFELGWLYAEKEADEAAAIYHYQKYLQLRPNASNAENIRQHILRLKHELAKAVMPIPPSSDLLRQLDQVVQEKQQLQGEVDRLQRQIAQISAAQASVAPRPELRTSATAFATRSNPVAPTTSSLRTPTTLSTRANYRIKDGDTLMSIARRHNVRLESLQAANPRLDARRLQPGQTIVIPRQ
jgi:tetratricopeptide (TPR) repeat protein